MVRTRASQAVGVDGDGDIEPLIEPPVRRRPAKVAAGGGGGDVDIEPGIEAPVRRGRSAKVTAGGGGGDGDIEPGIEAPVRRARPAKVTVGGGGGDGDIEPGIEAPVRRGKPVKVALVPPTISRTTTASSSVATDNDNTAAETGVSKVEKKNITDFIADCFDDCQRMNSRQRKSLYITFRKMFYKHKSLLTTNDYQKYFAQSFWLFAVLFFKAPNSQPVHSALKFLHHVILNAGTPEDKAEEGFEMETRPFYYYIIKLYLQCHMDERQLVRLRLIHVAHAILSQHRNVSPLAENQGMRKQLIECFLERLKDRHAPVRAFAATCLKFYAQNESEIIKRLKYFARFDPSPEVRKAVLATLSNIIGIKTVFFYDFVFDSDAKVRVEAFSLLATRPMVHLKAEESSKAIVWGLSHDDKSKDVVVAKLIPAWMEQCDKNPVEFLKRLAIVKKPKVVETVMNGVYLNNFTETLETIDLSFLNEDKVIPIENLTLESAMFWMYLTKKFGNTRHNKEKLLPQSDFMIAYIKKIIHAVHTEHRVAREEDRDEDGTLLICLTYMVPMVLMIGLEEGNRRNMEDVLREILLDPVMDEAPVIKMGVDALFRILDKSVFSDKMMEIFQAVFEPDQTIMDQTLEDSPKRRSGFRPVSRESGVHRSRQDVVAVMDSDDDEDIRVDAVAPEVEEKVSTPPPSLPITQPSRRVLTERELLAMKNKLCNLALERLHLSEERTSAIQSDNYLEAHRIQQQIDVLIAEEKGIRAKMELTDGTVGSMSDFSVSSKSSHRTNETSLMEMEEQEMELDEPVPAPSAENSKSTSKGSKNNTRSNTIHGEQEEDVPLSQGTTVGGDGVGISMQNILKGVLMMNRFLSCRPKITPFVRQFYELYAVGHFTNDANDTHTRIELLNFLCLFGMIDSDEKRKIMGLVIIALTHDIDPEIKSAAFKCMVDLLCRYEVKQFRYGGDTDQVYLAAPALFNKLDASVIELQAMFVSIIDKFATVEISTPDAENIKAIGILKLLTADRITSEFVVADVLCMWCNTAFQGTNIPYEIGIWLPIYTKLCIQNARLVGKALFLSVIRIARSNEKKNCDLQGVDIAKLVDFVLPFVSTSHIKPREDEYINIHEDIYEKIIDHILQQTRKTVNLDLVQILSKLSVESDQKASFIVGEISHALLKLASMPPTPTIATLKIALKKAGKRMAMKFEELTDQLMEILSKADERGNISIITGDDGSDDDDALDPNPFSDEEEEEGEK